MGTYKVGVMIRGSFEGSFKRVLWDLGFRV